MRKLIYITVIAIIGVACNKEKKFMDRMTGNWNIEKSEIIYIDSAGNEEVYESISNAGELVIFEGDEESTDSREYELTFINSDGDTLYAKDMLVTDGRKNRLILLNALNDSTYMSDIVWTVETNRKKKQVWSTFGVDSVLFYPPNNHNPGNAGSWVQWKVTLKKS